MAYQKKSYEEQEQEIQSLMEKLETGTREIYASGKHAEYLKAVNSFTDYSARNSLLILLQMEDASLVAGYQTWKNKYHRQVVDKCQIWIVAPAGPPSIIEQNVLDPRTLEPMLDASGTPLRETVNHGPSRFQRIPVWDISQTEGEPLPLMEYTCVPEELENREQYIAAFQKVAGCPILFEDSVTDGNIDPERGIILNGQLPDSQTVYTLCREVAGLRLGSGLPTKQKEIEAASVAYIAASHFKIDASDLTFSEVALWGAEQETKILLNSIDRIKKQAQSLINDLEDVLDGMAPAPVFIEIHHTNSERPDTPPKTAEAEKPVSIIEKPEESRVEQAVPYYPINETLARQAKAMWSMSDYVSGSATAEYRGQVDEAVRIAKRQKERVDPMFHEKIDRLLESYCRKLAENINHGFSIDLRCPSVLISGPANFPVRKKEKQNKASDKNMQEYQNIQYLLRKIQSVGTGGVRSDDPNAVDKLKVKLNNCQQTQEYMKRVNSYYRKHGTLKGCEGVTDENAARMEDSIKSIHQWDPVPFPGYELSSNNAEIRRLKERLTILQRDREIGYSGWEFEGGKAVANMEAGRLQLFFDEKPDEKIRASLKSHSFRWAPSESAWQRQLTREAIRSAGELDFIRPTTGESPLALQPKTPHVQREEAR